MCNLYRMDSSSAEIVRLFKARSSSATNAPAEIYPGYPGLVIASSELRSMVWGFPLVLKGKSGQPLKPKPCNNTRADKLDSFMWGYSFAAASNCKGAHWIDDDDLNAPQSVECELVSTRRSPPPPQQTSGHEQLPLGVLPN